MLMFCDTVFPPLFYPRWKRKAERGRRRESELMFECPVLQIQYTHTHIQRRLRARLVHSGLYTLSMLNRFTTVRLFFFFICSLNLSVPHPLNPFSICVRAVFSFSHTQGAMIIPQVRPHRHTTSS